MRIVVVGAGGQGLVVTDILLRSREAGADVEIVALLDDDPARHGGDVLGVRVVGPLEALPATGHDAIVVAIGDNARRREVARALARAGERIVAARHPFSSIAPDVALPAGAMVSAGAVVCPRVALGEGVLLNTKASVDHDSTVGAFAHVSAGATVGARCRIGEETLVGIGATVLSGVTIGARSVVGAGAVVVREVPDGVVAYGNPARVVRTNAPVRG